MISDRLMSTFFFLEGFSRINAAKKIILIVERERR